ncbi:SDR family NAD(P)-dependent oxidoreductase [Streptacidiphilus pinicola]|uniref:SDR family NAD(P)-dependent oxidoreductase n=1 Tax=Streptacidiphilus pinicola TaxID=2219663 RepID=A0A2X0J700_9ACTN|nr:SDR family oxidoreductase [Streptacidiphilus pinicola]RAG83208.1 SDR family NAD(P)-dependent oxidoreductase [Streptacidiphilus pinicola]
MILITGATGLTGSALVREFGRQARPARALVRDPAKGRTEREAAGVSTVRGDLLAAETLAPALDGVETVVLISSADDRMVEAQGNLIDAAVAAGVRHVVKMSGLGIDPDSVFRYGRYHAQVEEHLRAAPVAATVLRPSQFMQVYYREVPTMLADGTFAQPLGETRLAPVDVEDLAKVAFAAATGPAPEHGETDVLPMTGPEALSMTEVCAILSETVGRPIRYVDLTPEEKHRHLVAAGIPPRFADDLDDLFRLRREGGPESRVDVTAFERFGIRPTTFAQFALRSAPVFRGETAPERLWAAGWLDTERLDTDRTTGTAR